MIEVGLAAGAVKQQSHLTPELLMSPAAFVTFGSDTLPPLDGNKDPVYYYDEVTGASYNAVGLKNRGLTASLLTLAEESNTVRQSGKQYRKSYAPTAPGSLHEMLTHLTRMPLRTFIDEHEFNAACVNYREGEHLHPVLARDPVALREFLEETALAALSPAEKALKIAPDTDEETLRKTVDLCIEFGIGRIVSGNTRKVATPIVDGKPVISVDFCGQGGAALFRSGLRQMRRLAKIREEYKAPLKFDACGGILSGKHLRMYENEGADRGQIMTGYLQFTAKIFQNVLVGM